MEANSQLPVNEYSLPEVILDKNGLVVGTIKARAMAESIKGFNNKMNEAAKAIQNAAETANKVFPKGFL